MKIALFFLFTSCLFIPIIGQGNKEDMSQQQENINCNDDNNRQSPQCLKGETTQILDEMKTNMPGFINEMKNQAETFSKLNPTEQNTFLQGEIQNFGDFEIIDEDDKSSINLEDNSNLNKSKKKQNNKLKMEIESGKFIINFQLSVFSFQF